MKSIITTMLLLLLSITTQAQSADALYEQGKKLYDEKKYAEAVKKLLPAAQKGHKKAQYRMGRCYDKGYGVEEDNNKAFEWYSKAAAQNYHKGQYQLGRCYKKGKGVAKDKVKAFELFTKAAKQGNAKAQFALGECYFAGKGVAQDKAKAKTLFTKALADEKDGKEILQELKDDAAAGDQDAIAIKQFLGK